MKEIVKKYSNGEVTVVWKPGICIHSAICFRGLPTVFNPGKRPWITAEAAGTDALIAQIDQCPSGALSYFYNEREKEPEAPAKDALIEITPNGPILIHGNITVQHASGEKEQKSKITAFCRCGHSANKPFCDGSHRVQGFKG